MNARRRRDETSVARRDSLGGKGHGPEAKDDEWMRFGKVLKVHALGVCGIHDDLTFLLTRVSALACPVMV